MLKRKESCLKQITKQQYLHAVVKYACNIDEKNACLLYKPKEIREKTPRDQNMSPKVSLREK